MQEAIYVLSLCQSIMSLFLILGHWLERIFESNVRDYQGSVSRRKYRHFF